MADPAGVISLGIEVIKGLLWYYEGYKGYDRDVMQASQTVSQLQQILLLVQTHLDDRCLRPEIRQSLCSSVQSCSESIAALQRKLQKIQASSKPNAPSDCSSLRVKSLYPFKRSTLAKLTEIVNDSQARLQVALSVLGLDKLSIFNNGIANLIADNQSQRVLDWLPSIDFITQKDAILRKATEGTGHHLLFSPEFKSLKDGLSQTLYCSGSAGAGKTILACIAIRHLNDTHLSPQNHAICYAICNHKLEKAGLEIRIFSSIVSQMLVRLSYCPTHVVDLWNRHMRSGLPTLNELVSTIKTLVDLFQQVFLIIDALDEFPGDRRAFMDAIFELCSCKKMKIMVTSRPLPEISFRFQEWPCFLVSASADDIRRYILSQRDRFEESVRERETLCQEIENAIVKGSAGIFLVAALHLDSVIERATTPAKARKSIQNLSGTTDALKARYQETLDRIRAQTFGRRDLAEKALLFVTASPRQLTAIELTHALAVDIDEDPHDKAWADFDRDDIPDIKLVLSSCLGLLTVTDKQEMVQFVHYTVQEFFENQCDFLQNGSIALGNACIRYLSSSALLEGDDSTVAEFPLAHFAVVFLGLHFKRSPPKSYLDAIFHFLSDERRVKLVGSLIQLNQYTGRVGFSDVSGLHLVAYFGLTQLVDGMLACGQNINGIADGRFTPLAWAVNGGHTSCVEKLLDRGALITHPDVDYDYSAWNCFVHSPITMAMFRKQDQILDLILRHEALRHITVSGRSAALKYAALDGRTGVVQELAKNYSVWAKTPGLLSAAGGSGTLELVKMLLDHGADVNDETSYCTSILQACIHNHEHIVRWLVDHGAKIPIEGHLAQLTLNGAIWGGIDFVAETILYAGKIGVKCMPGPFAEAMPLDISVYKGRQNLVRVLLDHDADVNSLGLHLADMYLPDDDEATAAISQVMLESKSEIMTTGPAIQIAALTGRADITSILLENHADPNTENKTLGHVLQVASRVGADGVVKELLSHGSDVHASAGPFGTALEAARSRSHTRVETILMEAGAMK